MKIELLSILMATLASIFYFIVCYRLFIPYLYKINYPLNNATKFLLALSFIGASIVIFMFGEPTFMVFKSIGEKQLTSALFIFVSLFVVTCIYSVILFKFSALIVQITLLENEKAELAKNNFHVAGYHGVTHIFFALLLTDKVVSSVMPLFQNF